VVVEATDGDHGHAVTLRPVPPPPTTAAVAAATGKDDAVVVSVEQNPSQTDS
jgi:hypothetical protein